MPVTGTNTFKKYKNGHVTNNSDCCMIRLWLVISAFSDSALHSFLFFFFCFYQKWVAERLTKKEERQKGFC